MKKTITQFLVLLMLTTFMSAQSDMDDIVIGKYRKVKSEFMNEERLIYVHLPENYESSGKAYPVLFQLYSHFTYAYFLPAVRITERHGMHGKIPEMIVIGIKNREFRYRDLLPIDSRFSGKSQIDNFLNFFEKELIPFIEKNYRTNKFRMLSGPQAGAAFGIYALAKKPALFNAMFLSNPFWKTGVKSILYKSIFETMELNSLSKIFLMISYDEKESPEALMILKNFKQLVNSDPKNRPQLILNKVDPDFFSSYSTDLKKGLNILFKNYVFPAKDTGQELSIITDYYNNLSRDIGTKLDPPEMILVSEGDKFTKQKELNKALKIYKYILKKYPISLNAFYRLGNTYMALKDYKNSIFYFEKFLEVQKGNPMIESLIEKIKKKMEK